MHSHVWEHIGLNISTRLSSIASELTLANTKKNASNKYLFIAMQWRIHSCSLLAIALIQYLYFPCKHICCQQYTRIHMSIAHERYIVAINPMWHCHFNPIRFHLISFNIYHSTCFGSVWMQWLLVSNDENVAFPTAIVLESPISTCPNTTSDVDNNIVCNEDRNEFICGIAFH